MSNLTPDQDRVSRAFLAMQAERRHIVVAVSGAHAYGFPSPDSDVDLKSIHIVPTRELVGLNPPVLHATHLEVIDGVEIDYGSNEIGAVAAGILNGNGNYIERVLGPIRLIESDELAALQNLTRRSLSRRVHRHYHGFASSQLEAVTSASAPTAKKVLYVLRTALTGARALLTGEVVTDVTALLDMHGLSAAHALIALKRSGERVPLATGERTRWIAIAERAITILDEALAKSTLPEAPTNEPEVAAWLVDLRKRQWE